MSLRKLFTHRSTLVISVGLSLAACDSAVITGPAPSELAIGAAQQAPTLLQNADFEAGSNAWQSCSPNGSAEIISDDASDGTQAMNINNGACLSQNVQVDTGATYQLNCQAKSAGDAWSSATMAFLDQNLQPLDRIEKAITSENYSTLVTTMTAPPFTSFAEILIYSEGSATIDDCTLREITVELPPIALANGEFNNGLENWQQCQSTGSAEVNNGNLELSGGTCVYQNIDVSEAVALSPDNQPMTLNLLCDAVAKTGDNHASFIVAFLDENNNPVANTESTITTATTSSAVRLNAPASASNAEIMIYSNADLTVGKCEINND